MNRPLQQAHEVHQVIQDIRSGKLVVAEVPAPLAQRGEVLIANVASVISAGTERMTIDLAKKSLLGKARERPDLVRRVLEKCRNEGVLTTLRQVRERLDTPLPMGYSSAGVVLACGAGVQHLKPGDRAASNGSHAGIVSVGKHLCAAIPEGVDFDQAAFAVLGAIALHGVRLARAELGESVLVIGLGLIGQIAVSLLAAAGCRVIGTDPDEKKCELALKMGAQRARPNLGEAQILADTGGLGADAVLITASTTSNRIRRLVFLWTGPLRSRLRRPRARLSGPLRPLDRAAKHSSRAGADGPWQARRAAADHAPFSDRRSLPRVRADPERGTTLSGRVARVSADSTRFVAPAQRASGAGQAVRSTCHRRAGRGKLCPARAAAGVA
jgi:hypothetical protein